MPETTLSPPATARSSKPLSEAILNEKVCFFHYFVKSQDTF